MARHFLQLYLLIILTLAWVSWSQERLWQAYGSSAAAALDHPAQAATLAVVADQLVGVPREDRAQLLSALAARSGVDLELFEPADVGGGQMPARLARGEPALMSAADGQTWILQRLDADGRVLAFRYSTHEDERSALEWGLALVFYAAIALVIMIWLWPLSRDLRRLERSTIRFGDRNWRYDAGIKPGSPVFRLARAFERMAQRIDSLIRSHQDLSNAMSHEIKTPLARMRFEIEMARTTAGPQQLAEHLNNIDADIAELNGFVTATLDYAILERAEVALNIAEHDFTLILPALTESVRRSAPPHLSLNCRIASAATAVSCDVHLMETVLRNLLYNAMRYAREQIQVSFDVEADGSYLLRVDDDGPGIAAADRLRVFESFVQLGAPGGAGGRKAGYGLGLAIVKRVIEWHGGQATVGCSGLGGAGFVIRWSKAPVS